MNEGNAITVNYGDIGVSLYVRIRRRSDGYYYRAAGFEAFNAAHVADYAVILADADGVGFYTGEFPAGVAAGVYDLILFEYTTSPTTADEDYGGETVEWDGTRFLRLSQVKERTDRIPDEPASVDDVHVSVAPLAAFLTRGQPVQSNWTLHTGEAKTVSWTLLDQQGQPVDQGGYTHRMVAYTDNTKRVRLFVESTIIISGDDHNVLTLVTTPANTSTRRAGQYPYAIIRNEGPEVVASGIIDLIATDLGA